MKTISRRSKTLSARFSTQPQVDSGNLGGKVSAQCSRMVICSVHVSCLAFVLVVTLAVSCYSADVVFIRSSDISSPDQQRLETATRFYGVNLEFVTLHGENRAIALSRAVGRRATVAVVIEANALALVNAKALLRVVNRRPGGSIPLLILGVTPQTDATLLQTWSGGAAIRCERATALRSPRYNIGHLENFTQQLSDADISFPGNEAVYFLLGEDNRAQEIMKVRDDGRVFPVFIETVVNEVQVFLDCIRLPSARVASEWNPETMVQEFTGLAPAMMFVKYSAGERGWHTIHHYANLTIDDPWLREPYGYLNYRNLLGEMERHNFHSTIAFIPWNYDRSDPEVVSLFRDHPDRLSICIHGDNHDHKEFTDYRSKPLPVQISALKQALGRMERFHVLTGIPYDKVLVFPHSIAPEGTLEALKTYNFLATVNSSNVPMDSAHSALLPFALRPFTVEFANFPSIRRYPVEVPTPVNFVAMNDFLDNPLFFYCHHDFFTGGISSFNSVADHVNRMEPTTKWVSAGEIGRHLYLVKLREDTIYDILSFSSDIRVDNMSRRDSIFYVRKQEDGRAAIRSVRVDGQNYTYRLHDGYLNLSMPVLAGKSRSVVIEYENDLISTGVDISKNSDRVYVLRMASDFRDIKLPRYGAGRALIALYYKDDATRDWALGCAVVLTACLVWVAWRLRSSVKRSEGMKDAGILS
jgi:hypothetical protein